MNKNPNPVSEFTDAVFEHVEDISKIAKKQILAKTQQALPADQVSQTDKKDPVTGKPIPKKKTLTDLQKATTQLAQMRLKKVREELEKQRLRTESSDQSKSKVGGLGPETKQEEAKPKEDIVQKTLKGSKSTGEFKGLVGG